jgi:hypothetical protein
MFRSSCLSVLFFNHVLPINHMTTFTTVDLSTLLYKKSLGVPSTLDTTASFSEPVRPARSSVLQSQIYAEIVPTVAPSDLANVTTDDASNLITGSIIGKKSTISPMIKRFIKVPLVAVPGSNQQAYECALDDTYGRILQDSIPFNIDPNGSYVYTLYKNDGTTVIPFGLQNWSLDNESGILTFYSDASVIGITAASPPRISFYRYVGKRGAATAEQTTAVVSDSALTFTRPETFIGGSTTDYTDPNASIIVDNRNIANLPANVPCMSLMFGGNYDGAWRLSIYGGGGDATQTSLHFQARIGGIWTTKDTYSAN